MVFMLPAILALLVLFSFMLYILAVFSGGKGGFTNSLSAVCFSSIPIIFIFIPILNLVAFLYWTCLLVLIFREVHKYKIRSAVINIVFPFLVVFMFMISTGIFNVSKFIYKLQSLT